MKSGNPLQTTLSRTAAALAAAALPFLAGCGSDSSGDASRAATAETREHRTGWRGIMLEEPVPAVEFTLTDTEGNPFRFPDDAFPDDGRRTVALLFFGYTHCPDVCPVQMANLGAVVQGLAPSVRERITVVFVTVDPRRDSRERIRRWLDRFGDGFVGLRGGEAEVTAIQDRMGLTPATRPPPVDSGAAPDADRADGGPPASGTPDGPAGAAPGASNGGRDYVVGHTSQVLAFTPDGEAHLAYPFGIRQRDWAHDLEKLVRQGWRSGSRAAPGD